MTVGAAVQLYTARVGISAAQCSTASLLSAFHSRSHVAFMPLYYDMKYSSYQGLTASSSLVYRGAVYHENLSYKITHTTQIKMFVSSLSEVDFILSQVNIILSKVNEKLDECPVDSRRTGQK